MTPSPPPVTQEEHDTHSEIYRIAVVVTGDQPTADEIALRLVAAGYRKPTPLPDDLEELERLARKAEASKFAGMYGYREVRDLQNACTPQRILSLLARLRGVTDGRQPQFKLGDRIAYRPGGKYPEWERDGPYYFAGMTVNPSHFMPMGAPNLHVSDRWPIQSPGDVTDGFSPEEWSGVTDVEGERGAAEGRPEAVTIYKCVNCGGRGVCAQLYPDKGTTERRTWQCRVCNGTGQARIASSPVATDGLDK